MSALVRTRPRSVSIGSLPVRRSTVRGAASAIVLTAVLAASALTGNLEVLGAKQAAEQRVTTSEATIGQAERRAFDQQDSRQRTQRLVIENRNAGASASGAIR